LDGTWWNGVGRTLFIDQKTYVIRAAADELGREQYNDTTINQPVRATWFEFDPKHQEQSPLP